jgi:hypothetical protein
MKRLDIHSFMCNPLDKIRRYLESTHHSSVCVEVIKEETVLVELFFLLINNLLTVWLSIMTAVKNMPNLVHLKKIK